MKKLLFIFLCFITTKFAAATAIVIIITPQYILIGADSKRQLLDANAVVQSQQQICKIKSAGTYCFALAGYTSSQATHFSAEKIINRHLAEAGSYAKAIHRIKAELKVTLTKELRFHRQQQPAAFTRITQTKEPLLEVVVLSMHNGVPQMEIIGFETGGESNVTVGSYTVRCPGDCPDGNQQLYFIGAYNGMENYLARQQQPATEPAALAKELIMEQAKTTPTSVGAPVHLVRFSAGGMEWIK